MSKEYSITRELFRQKMTKALLIAILMFFVLLAFVPFLYMFMVSLIEDGQSMKMSWNYLSNATWSFNNYGRVLKVGNFARYILNTIILCLISCFTTCALSSMAAYAFAKKKFHGNNLLYMCYLLVMMVPSTAFLIPLYLQIKDMGLINSYIGLAAPYAASGFGVIMLHSFMKNVPDELLEAADLDGCGEWKKFTQIVLPLIKPALISLTIFTFVTCWGSLLWPLISTTEKDMSVITVAVSRLKSDRFATNYGYIMAGSTLAFLPPFIVYIFLQKQFQEGIALSGIKG